MPGTCGRHGEWLTGQTRCPGCRAAEYALRKARMTPEQIEAARQYGREYAASHRELQRGRSREFYYRDLDASRERARDYAKTVRRSLRCQVIEAYGGKCACCGENEEAFLVIDHIDGGGNQHRREVGSTKQVYQWLVRHHYPDGFQILCANCNTAKARPQGCPHERKK